MSTENPYEAPRTDVTPPELRAKRRFWVKDRLMLIGTALGVFVCLMGTVIVCTVLKLPEEYIGYALAVPFFIGWPLYYLVTGRRKH